MSWNKPYAKLGSDYKKPDAVTVITKENYKEIVYPLPASELLYVGPTTTKKLARYGMNSIGDMVIAGHEGALKRIIGKLGDILWMLASGTDKGLVTKTDAKLKSYSKNI